MSASDSASSATSSIRLVLTPPRARPRPRRRPRPEPGGSSSAPAPAPKTDTDSASASASETDSDSDADPAYRAGDVVSGIVVARTTKPGGLRHLGLTVTLTGRTRIRLDPARVGVMDALVDGGRSVEWTRRVATLARGDDADATALRFGESTFEFQLPLAPTTPRQILETSRGALVSTEYRVEARLERSGVGLAGTALVVGAKTLVDAAEIVVEVPGAGGGAAARDGPARIAFRMTPETSYAVVSSVLPDGEDDVEDDDSLDSSRNRAAWPDFELVGEMDRAVDVSRGVLTGWVAVERAPAVASVEVRVARVETVPWIADVGGDTLREDTDVARVEVVDGDARRGVRVPFRVRVPRFAVAPSVDEPEFSVQYEASVVLELVDGRAYRGVVDVRAVRGEG